MASQTTCICCVEIPRPFRNERAALAPSTSKRFSAVKRSVKPRSCRIVATANNSASGARSAFSESNTPNSQERITWLKRNGSDALCDKSIASRTRTVSGTLIPAKTIPYLSRFHIVRGGDWLNPACPTGDKRDPSIQLASHFLVGRHSVSLSAMSSSPIRSSFLFLPLPRHPLLDIRRAMQHRDTFILAGIEEPNCFDVHEIDLL